MKIDFLGHLVHEGHHEAEMLRQRELAFELQQKPGGYYFFWGSAVPCGRCGRRMYFQWGENEESPSVSSQEEEHIRGIASVPVPKDARCPMPELKPVKIRFTCKSGRIALANDLRKYFPENPEWMSINSIRGQICYMEHYASMGYLTGFVGNTSVYFMPREGGLDVLHMWETEYQQSVAEMKKAVHAVSTELWWFALVDAADLPEGATDSWDRPIGYMNLEPGEYEMLFYMGESNLIAEIRRVA